MDKAEDRKTRLEQELKRITEIIIREYKPDRVILFGSLAQNNVREWSDIDLAIVKETQQRFIKRIGEIFQLTHPRLALNVVVYTPEEVGQMEKEGHYFWRDEITGKGKVLYDRAA